MTRPVAALGALALAGCAEEEEASFVGLWARERVSGTFDVYGSRDFVECGHSAVVLELGEDGTYVETVEAVDTDEPACGDPGESATHVETGDWTTFVMDRDATVYLALTRRSLESEYRKDGEVTSTVEDLTTWETWSRIDLGGEAPRWLWIEDRGRYQEPR